MLGLTLQLFYQPTLSWKPYGEGGAATGHSGSYDLFALADLEELAGLPGLDALFHAKGQYDHSVNADVGALSDPIDDADFDEPFYVSELWLQQSLWRGRFRMRAGLLEQQTMFDRNAYANSEDRQFLATFLDNDPLVPLPSGLGAALLVAPLPRMELAVSVGDADNEPRHAGFDTAFDDASSLTVLAELAFDVGFSRAGGVLPGTLRLGFFRDGRRLLRFGESDPDSGQPLTERGRLGAWLSFDHLAWREPGSEGEGLGVFARAGWSDPDKSAIEWFWSLGLQYAGLLPTRDADVVGLGAFQAIVSHELRDASATDLGSETGVELYYRVALLPWLHVTPDFQLLIDPGAVSDARDTVVLALRLRVTF